MKLNLPSITSPAQKTNELLAELADAIRSQQHSQGIASQITGSLTPIFYFPPTPPSVPLVDFSSGPSGLKSVVTTSIVPDGAFGTPVYFVLYNGQFSGWAVYTDASTPADSIPGGIVKAGDYNASTNPKTWTRIFGTSE